MPSRASLFAAVALLVSLALPACNRAQQQEKPKEDETWQNYRKAIGADPQQAAEAEAARKHGRELRSRGRCKHVALRASATPDADYEACRGERSSSPKEVHLAEFRAHYGGEVAAIRARCPAIRREVEKALTAFRASHLGTEPLPADDLGRFFHAWEVFCVDGEVY
jgi:hypothetical protein